MSLLEQQNFLAKLYTDEKVRRKFIAEPKKIGNKNKLDKNEIEEISKILPDEIEAFAESLFHKRLREVERLLPLLSKELGESFEKLFRKFAQNFTPLTVKKHLEDAIEFAKFLQTKNSTPNWLKDFAKFEQAKLEFGGLGKSFIIKKFNFDLRQIERNKANKMKELTKRRTFAVWLKVGNYHNHFIF